MITDQELSGIKNTIVFDSFIKARSVLKNHKNIQVSISGGSDSDVVLDIIHKIADPAIQNIHYCFFDTGVEYQATKDHLAYLENKYGITIERERAIKPIPSCTKEFGQPFISKFVSEHIERLQAHGFKFEDKSYDELVKEYRNISGSLKWWTNAHVLQKEYRTSQFNINRNKWLKEFLIDNPPKFKISAKCCTYSKKKVAKKYVKDNQIDLVVIGVRKAEGGVRSVAYDGCYTIGSNGKVDNYRPVFWYSDDDKRYYEEHFGIIHSRCYTEYGFKRTGCVGCPYNRNFDEELKTTELQEPKLYKACTTIFQDAYEYTRQYKEFKEIMNAKEKYGHDQMTIYDI